MVPDSPSVSVFVKVGLPPANTHTHRSPLYQGAERSCKIVENAENTDFLLCFPNSGPMIPDPSFPEPSSHLLTDMAATHRNFFFFFFTKEVFIGGAKEKQGRIEGKAGEMEERPSYEARATKTLIPNEQVS